MADATITLEARAAQTAERLLEMGEPKAAQDLLYAALSRAPSDVELLMPFARACQATGAEALMVQIFDRAVAETPDLPIYMAPDFFRRRSLARDRGIPSVLLITLGQCGSLYLRSLFEDGLDMPWCYVCAPGYLDGYLLPSWMQRIAGGGAVCNEHANPTEENVEILKRSGVTRMVLHDRDLRQSYISWCSHVLMAQGQFASVEEMRETDTFAAFLDENLERVVGQRAQWVNGWKDIAARHSDLDILFTHYEDMTDTPREFMNTLLEFYDIPADRFDFSLLKQKPVQGQKNYRKGERESWRSILNDDQLARIRDLA
ncbi:MAG: sulfotransferase domain-containing protein [Alphaproteobacteria bacterium]|uniref:sulfotransferase domain-containing protein n=1 Tax=Pacificispira sp. TaxID=2888761 RepID=UPI0032F134D5